ncbi:PhzF family phenazine biosynthesis protein [Aciditerrimonas ferrireducens]|uniref:PhzF family phenazine biosynthesis protein n=1 Tax=Aciditerrimonas ferrireducens TaxID=667306 RepID=A0ABV6C280_9ACTN
MSVAHLLEAFTEGPGTGNPAGVVLLARWPEEAWMQAVAARLGLSETAFVVPGPAPGRAGLRWFTPRTEVALCGHATLAAAWVVGRETVTFETASGPLACRLIPTGLVEAELPVDPPVARPVPEGLVLPELTWFGEGRFDAVAVLARAEAVRAVQPDLGDLAGRSWRGLVVTAPGDDDGVDFVSRYFAPAVGVPEDPVTGSTHCLLAELWGERLGRRRLSARQLSARGGRLELERRGPVVAVGGRVEEVGRVSLAGP